MNRKATKPEVDQKPGTPLGFMCYPPNAAAIFDDNDTYIIVTNKKTAERVINDIFSPADKSTLPQ